MAWLGKVSLGGFSDLAGAVNKLSESVKNIEKNFDSALGLEEKPDSGEDSGIWASTTERSALFDPVMAFMGHKEDTSAVEAAGKPESPERPSSDEKHDKVPEEGSTKSISETVSPLDEENTDFESKRDSQTAGSPSVVAEEHDEGKTEADSNCPHSETDGPATSNNERPTYVAAEALPNEGKEVSASDEPDPEKSGQTTVDGIEKSDINGISLPDSLPQESKLQADLEKHETNAEKLVDSSAEPTDMPHNVPGSMEADSLLKVAVNVSPDENMKEHSSNSVSYGEDHDKSTGSWSHSMNSSSESLDVGSQGKEVDNREQPMTSTQHMPNSIGSLEEFEKLKKDKKLMEAALHGAARQAQAKADEIARLMNENEQLRTTIEDLKKRTTEAEIDALRDEYHQRVASLERKVYALTKERDALKKEQSKKSDVAVLLKEKDEIITQVMAEGEELSKKQAVQESTIRKLRAQIREIEEEKQRLNSRIQVEETKVESIKRDKAATEKLLQETIEKNQAELAAQKEFYTNALNAAKEAEALAESRANNEARIELERRLREADERESMLVQSLEELRQTLSRTEQQAVFREDMLRRDLDDLQKRYQASELRYNELVAQVPESTRPLLRQIEAMQETAARRAEAWAGVERSLNSRLQEAEAKAAAAEERERSMNERLSQALSRMSVLETQITCLRTEQTQLSRSLEKERQRASENRQEYLVAMEEAATQEGRAKQLEEEIKELRNKYKKELQEEIASRVIVEKELEKERALRTELEKAALQEPIVVGDQGNAPTRKLPTARSLGVIEESHYLQASLDSTDILSERRGSGEAIMSPYFLKSMTPSSFEAALRQKDGELQSYVSRLNSLESTRDSLAEELVKMTAQCEKLRSEATILPGIRAELEALRRRHSSALELMGERDEELEELRADIIDLKEMYREQVDLLVNKIQTLGASLGAA
ncbi:golgin candidate 5 isoform X2 [Dioscorea cayenensis subsp. rotundata]|uniref:Golgin candidate 5 isoform X2 n=1 Tax=Dioscorea cayennensis subsp. rotundata TaxID=55577 RepID=A0AB40B322_DIOCR|nr:golgin candidate 5 isoform X2 [Dioscorea cayenensis subsp. rotundata]